jgi:ABC-2 type transport system ATP-binding protein
MLSTHNLNEVETACARAIIVSRGRVVADGALADIRAKSGSVRTTITVGAQGLSGGSVGEAEVKGALASVSGATAVNALPAEGSFRFDVTSAQDVDLRADLFRLAVAKGWLLLELAREAQALEDVFRDLTLGDERKNRELSAA